MTSYVDIQYIPRNMHTVFALLCFVVVIHWLIFPYPSGLLHWHCGNLTIAPVPAKQPWWIWINASCEFIMTDCITTTKQSTTKPCAYLLGYTVYLGQRWLRLWVVARLRKTIIQNQCSLFIRRVLWHSPESNFTLSDPATILYNEFGNYTFKITVTSSRANESIKLCRFDLKS